MGGDLSAALGVVRLSPPVAAMQLIGMKRIFNEFLRILKISLELLRLTGFQKEIKTS